MNISLIEAAFDGNEKAVDSLLLAGANVNATTQDGISALMYASQNGNINIVNKLLAFGALVDAKPFDGVTSLIAAVRSNQPEIAELLIRNNAEIDIKDFYGGSPLYYAAAFGLDTMADMLIYYDASVNITDDAGTTPLAIAALNGNINIVSLLLSYKAIIDKFDNYGFTSLMNAVQNNFSDCAKMLIDSGSNINAQNLTGFSPLHIAAVKGNDVMCDSLLKWNANPCTENVFHESPLFSAKMNGNFTVAHTLRKKCKILSYKPYIGKITFSYDMNFNNKDMMLGGTVGIAEINYNFSANAGFMQRIIPETVLVYESENLSYQFLERRYVFFISLLKNFNIIFNRKSAFGFNLGIKPQLTYGSYRGSDTSPDTKILFAPISGIFWTSKHFYFTMNYEYSDFGSFKIPASKIGFSVQFLFNTKRTKFKDKLIDWM